jgi:uncharacterized protein (UPF0128 family)
LGTPILKQYSKFEFSIKKAPATRKLSFREDSKEYIKMGTKQTLQQVRDELRSITKNLAQITSSIGVIVAALEKINGEKSPQLKSKRAPVRKKLVVKDGVVETIKRVPATKIVFDVLSKSDQGMDTNALMTATGYDQRKVYNVVFRLKKEGKIESVARGIYRAR